MPLHAVRAADHQHRAVQHRQCPLHLGGKVHMPRRIQQRNGAVPYLQHRLLGKDGDAPLALHIVRIQERIPVIHPPQAADSAGTVEQRLGKGGLSRVHMG